MMVYLDTNIVIYVVEEAGSLGETAALRLGALRAEGHGLVVSPLVRMECLVSPLATDNAQLLADYRDFLDSLTEVAVVAAAFDRAAAARAQYHLRALDALHLATAIEAGCGLFLTNDQRLADFPDIPVETLG